MQHDILETQIMPSRSRCPAPQRILVTGASRGIGHATASALAELGHTVILVARDVAALEQLAREIRSRGGQAEVLPMDLTDDASVQAGLAPLEQAGGCDVLVNNAGLCVQGELLTQSDSTRRSEFELNYWGVMRITLALLPRFVERGQGVIVNVSSLLGSVPAATTANYCASKAALEAFSHALRAEVSRFGIKVVIFVAPHTATADNRVEFEGVVKLPVDYVARQLVRAVERAPRRHVASPVYRVLLLLARLFPAFMRAQIHKGVVHLLRTDLRGAQ